MEKLKITLELTLEEARFVLSKLKQFRDEQEVANKQQPEPNPQPDPKPFKLEYGKRYKRRDGKITTPLVVNDGLRSCPLIYPFKDLCSSWMPNGSYSENMPNHPYDLIEEA
jgi:hypothetical protein